MRLRNALIAISVLLPAYAEASDVLYCTAIGSTGFHYSEKSKRYESATFNENRYTMKFEDNDKELAVSSSKGKENYTCTLIYSDVIQCVERAYFMIFSPDKKRFYRAQMFGDMKQFKNSGGDSLVLEHGTCAQF